jgi:D-sedoheptulose 7-phosphate isomerase
MKIDAYYQILRQLTQGIVVTDRSGKKLNLQSGFEKTVRLINICRKNGRKLIFIGNGASASIASHMAADFWKNGKIKAIAFNDAALLTSISNDFGYPFVFEKPISAFADAGDILFAISSSGASENILRAVRMARKKHVLVISLSGFKENNPLRKLGHLNFYVPSDKYGYVEVIHHSICHCLLDTLASTVTKERKK